MKKILTVKDSATIGIFAAVTAVLSPFSVPLPFTMIPITLGVVAVYITGILLKPKQAVLAQVVYLLLGAAGLPVFSGFRGGLAALLGPTGGYLFVYPVMAGIVSVAMNGLTGLPAVRLSNHIKAAASMFVAHIFLYSSGTAWMCATTGNTVAATLGLTVYPYIVVDIIKIAFCSTAVVQLRSRLQAMSLLA